MASDDFDVVVLDGRVMDPETGTDRVLNVGVLDGSIVALTTEAISGRQMIDAKGLIVCPGFIDMHHHNSGVPFGEKLALRDGVTTPLELEAGISHVKDWYDALKGRCRTNYGASVGSIPVRESIFNGKYKTRYAGDFLYDLMARGANTSMAWSTQRATSDQLGAFETMLKDGLAEGAIGIGHAVGYMVAGCSQQESLTCQMLAGQNKQAVYLHGRFSSQMPPTSGILGTCEMMAPQEVYGGGLVVQHITAQTLNDTIAALELINKARDAGIQVLAEVYPYDFGGSIVSADYLHPDNYGPNMGREYKDIIETATMAPLTKEKYEELVKTAPGTGIMFYNATIETVHAALSDPHTVLGSDAFPYNLRSNGEVAMDWNTPFESVNGHPRGAGSHARLLRWVREGTVTVPLMNAIGKMSYFIADFLQNNGVPAMAKKGRIQEGMDADIVLFDPETVTDNATTQDGGLPSSGIDWVLVNGVVVVREGVNVDDVFPGQPVFGAGLAA